MAIDGIAAVIGQARGNIRVFQGINDFITTDAALCVEKAISVEWVSLDGKSSILAVHEALNGTSEWKVFQAMSKGQPKMKLIIMQKHIVRCSIPGILRESSPEEPTNLIINFEEAGDMQVLSRTISAFLAACVSRNTCQSDGDSTVKSSLLGSFQPATHTIQIMALSCAFIEKLQSKKLNASNQPLLRIDASIEVASMVAHLCAALLTPIAVVNGHDDQWRDILVRCSHSHPLALADILIRHKAVHFVAPASENNFKCSGKQVASLDITGRAQNTCPIVLEDQKDEEYVPLVKKLNEPFALSSILPPDLLALANRCIPLLKRKYAGTARGVDEKELSACLAEIRNFAKESDQATRQALDNFVQDIIHVYGKCNA